MITSLSNFSGIQKEVDIAIITLDDNILHTYCSEITWQKDNSMPIGIAKLIMPYSLQIEKYWVKYYGGVVVHANLNNKPKITQNDTATIQQMPAKDVLQQHENDKIRLQNDEYNYSFIGKVSRFKQEGKKFILYLEDLGWKFLQKVPDEFRRTYIAGQTLDNAFQAICEFMGVDFAYSIEKLSEYNFAADGYSVEKDGTIIESVPTILTEYKDSDTNENKNEDEQMADALNSNLEVSGLIEYKNKKEENQQENNQVSNQALNQSITNQRTNDPTQETNIENEKVEKYQEEFDKKIEDLFKGNTLYDSNISDPILNYNAITITPTAQTNNSTDISTSNSSDTNNDSTTNNEDELESTNDNNTVGHTEHSTSTKYLKEGMGKTKLGSLYLTKKYINNLSPSEAYSLYLKGKKNNTYTAATMDKLFKRSLHLYIY